MRTCKRGHLVDKGRCNICKNYRQRKWRSENPEKVKQYVYEYSEKARTQKKEYNRKNFERISKTRKAYREKNAKKIKEYFNSDKRRNSVYLREYGITIEEYNKLFSKQNGVCAICGQESKNKRLHIDHNHGSGKVRGLLCNGCNRALGWFGDNISILKSAIQYLEINDVAAIIREEVEREGKSAE